MLRSCFGRRGPRVWQFGTRLNLLCVRKHKAAKATFAGGRSNLFRAVGAFLCIGIVSQTESLPFRHAIVLPRAQRWAAFKQGASVRTAPIPWSIAGYQSIRWPANQNNTR